MAGSSEPGRLPINDGDILDHAGQRDRKRIREVHCGQNLMVAIELDEQLVIQPSGGRATYKGHQRSCGRCRSTVCHPHFVLVYEVDARGKVYILRVLRCFCRSGHRGAVGYKTSDGDARTMNNDELATLTCGWDTTVTSDDCWKGWAISHRQKRKKLIMLPSETMIWQPEFWMSALREETRGGSLSRVSIVLDKITAIHRVKRVLLR